jgi:hypothetical protein
MPATSRSGERRTAPLLDRPVRLALEVEHHPAPGQSQDLAQVQVAVDADGAPEVVRGAQPLVHLLDPLRLEVTRRDAVQLCGHVGGPGRAVGGFGTERLGQRHVEGRDVAAELVGLLGEVQLAVPGRATAVEHLPQRRRGQLDAVAAAALVAAGDGEVGVAAPPHRDGHRHRAEADPAERLGHLDVGVGAGLDPPEHLEDVALVEHQRRVGLLAGLGPDRPDVESGGHDRAELQGQLLVGQGVEEVRVAPGSLEAPDVGDVGELVGALRRGTQRELVPRRVAPAAIGAHLGEHPQQAGPAVDECVDPTDLGPGGRRPRRTTADRPGTEAAGGRARRRMNQRRCVVSTRSGRAGSNPPPPGGPSSRGQEAGSVSSNQRKP